MTSADCKPSGNCTSYVCTAGTCVETPINEGMAFPDPDGSVCCDPGQSCNNGLQQCKP